MIYVKRAKTKTPEKNKRVEAVVAGCYSLRRLSEMSRKKRETSQRSSHPKKKKKVKYTSHSPSSAYRFPLLLSMSKTGKNHGERPSVVVSLSLPFRLFLPLTSSEAPTSFARPSERTSLCTPVSNPYAFGPPRPWA